MTVRNPAVAGQFYPGRAEQLRAMIKGMVNEKAAREEVVGIVIPHAGYIYSGPVTGATISRIEMKDTFVIIGPNHTGEGVPFSIMTEGTWKTPLGQVEIDSELAERILTASKHLRQDTQAHRYEHSVELQLPFLQYFKPDFKFVPIVLSHAPGNTYKDIGRGIAEAIKETGRQTVIIASSDMTHYEPQERARSKDSQAIEAMLHLDADELLERVKELDITMCGYAAAVSLITAAKELGATQAELVKYQTSGDVIGDFSSVVGYAGLIIKKMSPIASLARQTVESYVREHRTPTPRPEELTPEMKQQAGVFVSIHKLGDLRGCIGTFEPLTENVAREIISNAVASATRDPRFRPITPGELKDLEYSVDVLTTPEPVDSVDELDPKKYGVIVQCGYSRGLLLPDLEGVDSVEEQIDICRQKAGISLHEPVKLYRFEVKRYK